MTEDTYKNIAFSIRHMRKSQVEPETVLMNKRIYKSLGNPKKVLNVPVDIDNDLPCQWMVR